MEKSKIIAAIERARMGIRPYLTIKGITKTFDFRVSDISGVARREARCYRVANSVSAGGGFAKAKQSRLRAGQGLGRPAEGDIWPKIYPAFRGIAAAFCEPNSPHCPE